MRKFNTNGSIFELFFHSSIWFFVKQNSCNLWYFSHIFILKQKIQIMWNDYIFSILSNCQSVNFSFWNNVSTQNHPSFFLLICFTVVKINSRIAIKMKIISKPFNVLRSNFTVCLTNNGRNVFLWSTVAHVFGFILPFTGFILCFAVYFPNPNL